MSTQPVRHALPTETDLALRAPLPTSSSSRLRYEDHAVAIRPLLCRMFVACKILRLGQESRFTALVLLHRYFDAVWDGGYDPSDVAPSNWVAAACLFLACKIEEEPRRLRDVINLAQMLLTTDIGTSKDSCISETIRLEKEPPHLNEDYWEIKRKIVATEQIVLRWCGFDVSISHPHRAVVLLLEQEENQKRLVSVAHQRLNDALFFAPALRHLALELACAAIELATQQEGCGLSHFGDEWWTQYGVATEILRQTQCDIERATNELEQCCKEHGNTATTEVAAG